MIQPRWWRFALAWLLAMIVLALASPEWRELDWWLFACRERASAPQLLDDLVLIDVPHDEDVGRFRRRLLQVLAQLDSPGPAPRALVFDVQFVNNDAQVPELLAAMARFSKRGTKLFAVVDPMDDMNPDPHYMRHHSAPIYDNALDGQGHTVFHSAAGLVEYEPLLDLGQGVTVPALAIQVAQVLFGRPPGADMRPIVVRLGDPAAIQARTLRLDEVTGTLTSTSPRVETQGRIAILGSLKEDWPQGKDKPSGPEDLLWALSARGLTSDRAEARIAYGPGLLTAMLLAGAGLATATAWLAYALVPRSHSHVVVTGFVAAGVPLALLAAGSEALAAMNVLLPQVTLPALGAILAAAMAAWFVRRTLIWISIHPGEHSLPAEHDVFISYSRTDPADAQWLREQVVKPLLKALKPDGELFRVFFDTDSLHAGDTWLPRLYHTIDACRFFVPVYSDDYFVKDFCKREIEHALQYQHVGRVYIVGVDLAGKAIPSPYGNFQVIRAMHDRGEVAARLIDAMQRALQADAAAKAQPPAAFRADS